MNILSLPPRQRTIIHILKQARAFVTSEELAAETACSSRTIRNDIKEINLLLADDNAQIISERSKGYRYQENENEESGIDLFKEEPGSYKKTDGSGNLFQTKEDRVDYLAFRLCLSEKPISLYDLEEEMFVSRSTLEKDLKLLRNKFSDNLPHIVIIRSGDTVWFSQEEEKIRLLLNLLHSPDWNYGGSRNIFRHSFYLESELLDVIGKTVYGILGEKGMVQEDDALRALILEIAIACKRNKEGHLLLDNVIPDGADQESRDAAELILNELEEKLNCFFTEADRKMISIRISSGHFVDLLDRDSLNDENFPEESREIVREYLDLIKERFLIDFSAFGDYRGMLCIFLQKLSGNAHCFVVQENQSILKKRLIIEFERAWQMRELVKAKLGISLHQSELLYIAYCNQVAMDHLQERHPARKLRTVIVSQYGLPALWSFAGMLQGTFGRYMQICSMIPENRMDDHDYSDAELVITTVNRTPAALKSKKSVYIQSIHDTTDYPRIFAALKEKQMGTIVSENGRVAREMLKNCSWHVLPDDMSDKEILSTLSADLFQDEKRREEYLSDILERENTSTNLLDQEIFFQYSLVPADISALSVAFMKNRITRKNFRIRIVILGAFREEHRPQLFYFLHAFYNDQLDKTSLRMLRTREDFIRIFSEN